MIVGMFMLFTFSLVDTWFISFLGTDSLTAISFTFPVTFTVTSLAIGLGIGAAAVVGKCLGSSAFEAAKQAATVINYLSFGLAAALATCLWWFMEPIFGLMGADPALFSVISAYMNVWFPGSVLVVCIMSGNSVLRACGDTKTPSILMAAAGLLNAVLDPFLIFGLGPFPGTGYRRRSLGDGDCLVGWLRLPDAPSRHPAGAGFRQLALSGGLPTIWPRYAPNRHSCCRCQHDDSAGEWRHDSNRGRLRWQCGSRLRRWRASRTHGNLVGFGHVFIATAAHQSELRRRAPGQESGRLTIWRSASSACGSWGSTCFWPSPRHGLLLFFLRITR